MRNRGVEIGVEVVEVSGCVAEKYLGERLGNSGMSKRTFANLSKYVEMISHVVGAYAVSQSSHIHGCRSVRRCS